MTICPDSVCEMADGIIYLLEKGAVVHPNVACEKKQWNREQLSEYARQLNKLIDYYSAHPEMPRISQLSHNLAEYAYCLESDFRQQEMCGAGNGFQVFDVDGSPYPCHILSPLVLTGAELERMKAGMFSQETDFSDSRCPYRSSCPTCLACNSDITYGAKRMEFYSMRFLRMTDSY